jgi:hypothetical protein
VTGVPCAARACFTHSLWRACARLPHGAQANLRYLPASENDGESYGMHSIHKSTRDIPRSTQASRAIQGARRGAAGHAS